ncbi:hypothetical protein, partial [Burkholderia gladioli]|uniref:hypothetical protein n=1 Tax=Burkholderia gladioli TaxID=28095 RepID=UPI001ABBD62F
SLQRVASAQRPEILLAARVSPTGKFSNLSVTACPVMQGQVQAQNPQETLPLRHALFYAGFPLMQHRSAAP